MTENKWQAVMFVKEKGENSGPLDPEEFKYKSVGGMMIGLGMAIPIGKWILRMMLLEPMMESWKGGITTL